MIQTHALVYLEVEASGLLVSSWVELLDFELVVCHI